MESLVIRRRDQTVVLKMFTRMKNRTKNLPNAFKITLVHIQIPNFRKSFLELSCLYSTILFWCKVQCLIKVYSSVKISHEAQMLSKSATLVVYAVNYKPL